MFGKKGSETLKLPPVYNCFTLKMTNKLVVIINSRMYQKLRKFYYMKCNFLYQITAASRTPDQGATIPRSPFSLSSTEFVDPPPKKIRGYATGCKDARNVHVRTTKSHGYTAVTLRPNVLPPLFCLLLYFPPSRLWPMSTRLVAVTTDSEQQARRLQGTVGN